jgi:hypothetical protein
MVKKNLPSPVGLWAPARVPIRSRGLILLPSWAPAGEETGTGWCYSYFDLKK